MKELYEKYKREVLVGVVVSIITAVIIKFGDWIIAVAPTVGTTILETVTNTIYTLAAIHTDSFLWTILTCGGLGFLIGMMSSSIKRGIHLYGAARHLEKITKGLHQKDLDKLTEKVKSEINEKKSEETESLSMIIQKGKQGGKASISLVFTIALLYLFIHFFLITPMNLYNRFTQDMVKIGPYVEETQIIQLKSDWVCMRSKADYDAIYILIDQTRAEYSLPK